MFRQIDRQTDRYKYSQIEREMERYMDIKTSREVDRQANIQMDGLKYSWMDKNVDGQIVGHIDE